MSRLTENEAHAIAVRHAARTGLYETDHEPRRWIVDAVLEAANSPRGMTDEKIMSVLALYEDRLRGLTSGPSGTKTIVHLLGMIPKIGAFLDEGRREKAFRWLGFMQGVLYALGHYTIEQMAEHNRPAAIEP